MARVKRGVQARRRHKKILNLAKGYYNARRKVFRVAKQAVIKAQQYAYIGRKQKKRNFRSLWITRINAASRANGLSYSRFMNGLLKAGITLDRKVLADIAGNDAAGFTALAGKARSARAAYVASHAGPGDGPGADHRMHAWGRAQVLPHFVFRGAVSMSDIQTLSARALADIAAAQTPEAVEALRVGLLGKQGSITSQLKQLGVLPPDQRKAAGEAINRARDEVSSALSARKALLEEAALDARLAGEAVDVTLPGRLPQRGGIHPITRTLERIASIFGNLGYELADGPEIEDDWHNFEALNFPPHHPARAMHDTFYFGDGRLLRTHTSGVQVRYMGDHAPPLRMIAAGKVYRSDSDQ